MGSQHRLGKERNKSSFRGGEDEDRKGALGGDTAQQQSDLVSCTYCLRGHCDGSGLRLLARFSGCHEKVLGGRKEVESCALVWVVVGGICRWMFGRSKKFPKKVEKYFSAKFLVVLEN